MLFIASKQPFMITFRSDNYETGLNAANSVIAETGNKGFQLSYTQS